MSMRLTAFLLSSLLLVACSSSNNTPVSTSPTPKQNTLTEPASQAKKVVLFDASTTGEDYHIWATDGSEDGTQPLLENYTMKATPSKDWMIEFNNKVVFFARPVVKGEDDDDDDHDHHKKTRSAQPNTKQDEPAKLFVTDGTKDGTKELTGTGENAFERVASPFYKIGDALYFAGYDKVDHYSIYKTDTQTVEKISKNFYQTIGLDSKSSFDIATFNNTLFLFTKLPQDNKIYVFDQTAKPSQWKEITSTDNNAVEAPIQAVTLNDFVFIFTKPIMGNARHVYQINTKTHDAKLADSKFLFIGITKCFNTKVCGVQVTQGVVQLRTLTPNTDAKTVDLTLDKQAITASRINRTNPFHIMGDELYMLLSTPTPSLHKINEDGTLSQAVTVKETNFTIKDFAKRETDKQLITQHPTVNGLSWVYAQSSEDSCASHEDSKGNYEPWVIDTNTQTAVQLKDIRNEKNEVHITQDKCISSFTEQTRPKQIDNKIVFIANGGDSGEAPTGYEMWVTDGTKSGTKIIKDIAPKEANGVLVEKGHHHH